MIRFTLPTATLLTVIAGELFYTSPAHADDVTVVAPAPPAAQPTYDTVTRTQTRPDGREIGGGLITFGAAYGIAIGIAASSEHPGDNHLYVPLVGPWVDFADRGGCPQAGSCGRETVNHVLLAVDGVFQAVGVLSIVSAFVFPRTYEVTTTTTADAKPTLRFTPVEYEHGGLGLAAIGRF